MGVKLTTEDFIKRTKLVHGEKYDYSLTTYLNAKSKVTIICPTHGQFIQNATSHLSGCGCPKCGDINKSKSQQGTLNDFLESIKKIHGNKYDYSKVNYDGKDKKIIIICPIHGEFLQTPHNHKKGQECPKCSKRGKIELDYLLEQFKKVHLDRYDYSKVDYVNEMTKITVGCPRHGDFLISPNKHKQGGGCQKCKLSRGEALIMYYLTKNGINFIHQYRFKDCRNIKPLPFDFYLPELNVCIEFNGIQHYKVIPDFHGVKGFDRRKINDKIKMEYCQKNNIPLLIIKYDEDVNEVLSNYFKVV